MLRLPLDFSVFKEMRETDYLYVDKTRYAYTMITQGKYYFLSRPRRFGKSLLVSMLREVLTARRELFNGLWIDQSDYSWQEHGVIALDFSRMDISDAESFIRAMQLSLQELVSKHALAIDISSLTLAWALKAVVEALHQKFGKVAILVDEYDNPILHALQDVSRAKEIRDAMQRFFTAIKGLGEHINFVFITGVSSFTKAGLFSGINNLQVLTLEPNYAGICGYTEEEVDRNLAGYIDQWCEKEGQSKDALRAKIKEFYNGYAFGANVVKVYNPFSLMHALHKQRLENFWFQSGTPTFLVHELEKKYRQEEYRLFDPETFRVSRELLASFDVGTTPLPALMFQTGYLTIRDYDAERSLYSLGYPNSEVQDSMQKYLVSVFAQVSVGAVEEITSDLELALQKEDIEEAVSLLRRLFMHVPYQLHVKEEKFYHALLHMVCNVYGMRIISEQSISHGRIDLVVSLKNLIYVIEIKFNDSPEQALKQIEEMRYYEPFIKENKRIILLGLSFNRSEKKFDIAFASRSLN